MLFRVSQKTLQTSQHIAIGLGCPPEVEVSIDEDNCTLQTQDQEVLELGLN